MQKSKKKKQQTPSFQGQKGVMWGIKRGAVESHTEFWLFCVCSCFWVSMWHVSHSNYTQAWASSVTTHVVTLTKTMSRLRLRLFHVSFFLQPVCLSLPSSSRQIKEVKYSWGYLNDKGGDAGQIQRGFACDTWWQIVTIIVSCSSVVLVWKHWKCSTRCENKRQLHLTVSTADGTP